MSKNKHFFKFDNSEESLDKIIDEIVDEFFNNCEKTDNNQTEEIPPRAQICAEAAKLINGDRNKSYGDPAINLKAAQLMTNDFLTSYYESGKAMTQEDNAWLNAMQNVFIKLGRIATGEFKKDSYADCIGYLGIAYELALKTQQEKEEKNE